MQQMFLMLQQLQQQMQQQMQQVQQQLQKIQQQQPQQQQHALNFLTPGGGGGSQPPAHSAFAMPAPPVRPTAGFASASGLVTPQSTGLSTGRCAWALISPSSPCTSSLVVHACTALLDRLVGKLMSTSADMRIVTTFLFGTQSHLSDVELDSGSYVVAADATPLVMRSQSMVEEQRLVLAHAFESNQDSLLHPQSCVARRIFYIYLDHMAKNYNGASMGEMSQAWAFIRDKFIPLVRSLSLSPLVSTLFSPLLSSPLLSSLSLFPLFSLANGPVRSKPDTDPWSSACRRPRAVIGSGARSSSNWA